MFAATYEPVEDTEQYEALLGETAVLRSFVTDLIRLGGIAHLPGVRAQCAELGIEL